MSELKPSYQQVLQLLLIHLHLDKKSDVIASLYKLKQLFDQAKLDLDFCSLLYDGYIDPRSLLACLRKETYLQIHFS